MGCGASVKKSDDQLIAEIFDYLDVDGTQRLERDEIGLVWQKVHERQIAAARDYLRAVEARTADSMLEPGSHMSLIKFHGVLKKLDMHRSELEALHTQVLRGELARLQQELPSE